MWVSGWDLSSKKLAVCADHGDDVTYSAYELRHHPRDGGCSDAYELVAKWLAKQDWAWGYGTDAVAFVESPIGAARLNIQSMLVQALINGAVLAALQAHHIQTVPVAPGQWKKEMIGNGNAGKEIVAAWVSQNDQPMYTELAGDQDLLDAYVIYRFGRRISHRRSALTEADRHP